MSLEELSSAGQRRYIEYLAALPIEKRLEMALDTIDTARAFMEAGIRLRHPQASHKDVQAYVAALLCGPEVAFRLYGIRVQLP